MKKLLISLFLVFVLSGLVSASLLSKGSEIDVGGKTLTVRSVSEKSAVIDVDGTSDIVNSRQFKIINGIKVTINNIFSSSPEDSQVDLSAESLYVCGNGVCEDTENSNNCCKDCGCSNGLICVSDKCRKTSMDQCRRDKDCDDKNPSTVDLCKGTPKACLHIEDKICKSDSDCNDNNVCTKDECVNFDCLNTKISGCDPNSPTVNRSVTDNIENKQSTVENESSNNTKKENESIDGNSSIQNSEPVVEKRSFIVRVLSFIKSLFFKD